MLLAERIGLALRYLRTTRSLKQRQVADEAGITSSMLSSYENGKKIPTLVTLEKILVAMGCSLRDLVAALEKLRHREQSAQSPGPVRETVGTFAERAPASLESFDLDAIFGTVKPLHEEEREAFGAMLSGFCRWLRFLREYGEPSHQDVAGYPGSDWLE